MIFEFPEFPGVSGTVTEMHKFPKRVHPISPRSLRVSGTVTQMHKFVQYGNNVWPYYNFNKVLEPSEIYSTIANNPNNYMYVSQYTWNTNGTLGSAQKGFGPPSTWSSLTWYNQTYGYDGLNRLTSAQDANGSNTNWSRNFSYDEYGNMSVTGYAAEAK